MNIAVSFVTIFLVLFCGTFSYAQNVITGRVLNEKSNPISKVKVSVNKSPFTTTNKDGKFDLEIRSEKPKAVEIQKAGYELKDWKFDENLGLIITLAAEPKIFHGTYTYEDGKPVPNASISFVTTHATYSARSDISGKFQVLIPSDILLSEILSVTSNNQKLTFKVNAQDEFLVKYSKNKTQETTEKDGKRESSPIVSLSFLEKNKPIVGIEFIFDGIKMKTDAKGIVKVPRGALGKLKTNPYQIEKIDSTSASNFVISLKKAEPIEGDFNAVITQLEQQKQAVVVQNAAIYSKISEINDKLKNNKDLSEDERKQLRGSVLRLEGQLNENNRAFEEAQKKTSDLLTMVKNAIEQKDSVSQAANVRIKQIEEENEQEKAESRRTLIFISSIAIVLAIASFAFFNILRKVNKQKAEITAQANNLTQLNDLIVSKNEKITDSIRYAQTIQQAILPDDERMAAISKESFVLYKPKDIVSGDFYWVSDTNKQKDVFIACVDCTGHGVSGAFMSLIANTLLNQIVNQEGISDTATILEMLNSGIRKSLKQEQKVNKDGMDLSICKISHTENGTKIYFTGAKRPLWIVRNNTKIVEVFKGDLKSIGGDQRKNREFTVQAIDVFEGDMLYMMTDGFVDQCNVTKEKFGTKQLLELIPKIASKALFLQKNDLQNALASHQASEEQRDDISIIGLRF